MCSESVEMAHGFKEIRKSGGTSPNVKGCGERKVKSVREGKGIGSRRMFSTQFKLQVLDSYRADADCRGNQRATARKYGIHRRQIQKWLQMESSLRCSASESGEVALNLAGQAGRQRDGTCEAGCLPRPPSPSPVAVAERLEPPPNSPPPPQEDEEVNVDTISDSEEDDSGDSLYEQEQALDFTCAALSRRRLYSTTFKLQVLDSFYHEGGDLRATAVRFGVHRRQLQKWLSEEGLLRGELAAVYSSSSSSSEYSPSLSPCLDLSRKRKYEGGPFAAPEPPKRGVYLELETELPTSAQETALCLVKSTPPPPPLCEVSSTFDFVYRPPCEGSPTCLSTTSSSSSSTASSSPPASAYWACCADAPAYYDCWPNYACPYACITSRLHHDAVYYKQAVKDINLYSPLYS